MAAPNLVRMSLINLQVCVPKEFTDEQAEEAANQLHPTGISSKWTMREAEDPTQMGAPLRVQCQQHPENVHIMMVC